MAKQSEEKNLELPVETTKKSTVKFFTNAEDVVSTSAKSKRTALKSNVVSYHYTNDEKTIYQIRLDGEIVLANGRLEDTTKRRGFVLTDDYGTTVWFRTMQDVRNYVRDMMVVKVDGDTITATFRIVK